MAMTRILLTGFTPFGGHAVNPTEALVGALGPHLVLGDAEVFPRLLRTHYRLSEQDFDRAVAEVRPDAIVSFGLNYGIDEVRPERIAVNFDDGEEDGRHVARRIAEDGPVGYFSTLPVEPMVADLAAAGLPAKASNHAGAYICNHVFYYARHRFERERLSVPMGFVHVPPLPEMLKPEDARRPGLALERLVAAAKVAVSTVLRHLPAKIAA
jgi:pyroglutamyl-peptidase